MNSVLGQMTHPTSQQPRRTQGRATSTDLESKEPRGNRVILNTAVQDDTQSAWRRMGWAALFVVVSWGVVTPRAEADGGADGAARTVGPPTPGGTVTDNDGNVYPTVIIGKQEWMAANLRTTRFNDGTPIPQVTDGSKWSNLITPAFSWYDNDEKGHRDTYGALYNWFAVGTGRLCPKGWRVPTDADWQVLVDHVGGKTVAGGKLKSVQVAGGVRADLADVDELATGGPVATASTASEVPPLLRRTAPGWKEPNAGATNETGFNAVPGGRRSYQNGRTVFQSKGSYGYWWTSSEVSSATAWYRLMYDDNAHVSRITVNKADGLSVCCIRE